MKEKLKVLLAMPLEDFQEVIPGDNLSYRYANFKRDLAPYLCALDNEDYEKLIRYADEKIAWQNTPNKTFPFVYGG